MNEPVTSCPLAGVVDRVLRQRLAEALRQAAVHLALDDHPVERIAAVVHRRIGDEVERAGVGIDLHLGDVAAVGEGERRRRPCPWCRDFRRSPWRAARYRTARSCGRCRPPRSCRSRYWMSCSEASNSAEAIFLPFVQHHVGDVHDGVARAHGRARADRGAAGQAQRRIAVTVLDLGRVDAELVGQQPAEHGGMALPGRLHIQGEDQLVVAGKRSATPFPSAWRRHARACRTCRCRDISCVLPPRACAC